MYMNDRKEQEFFEDEVRRIARQLWPESEFSGALIIDDRERDGVFQTDECIHIVEATVSRKQEKAVNDAKKLADLAKKLRQKNSQIPVRCWFVTKDEPTADQRTVIVKQFKEVTPLSFSQFQNRLVDVSTYLEIRNRYPYGSVRDPVTGDALGDLEYIPLDIVENNSEQLWNIESISDDLIHGKHFVLLGDYGAGKSMTMREINKALRKSYFAGTTFNFPLYINLRDHMGQTDPAEILHRHGTRLGYSNPHHLVRAWRAGYTILLLDGFDEVATVGIQGIWKRLQDIRYRSMEAVRGFIDGQPQNCGLIVAGRAHYFDSESERRRSLGQTRNTIELTLNEFNEVQIRRYLSKQGLDGRIPSWMPSRPLLVGYLAASGTLKDIENSSGIDIKQTISDPAVGWNLILDRICNREARIEAGIDGQTIRQILERLATYCRRSQNGLGPIRADQLTSAFAEVCGYEPDDKGLLLLQRLPGLGIERADEGTRIFLDGELADACRSGDVSRYLQDPFSNDARVFQNAEKGLDSIGVALTVNNSIKYGLSEGTFAAVIEQLRKCDEIDVALVDVVRVGIELRFGFSSSFLISEVLVPQLDLQEGLPNCSNIEFRKCYFEHLSIDPDASDSFLPHFSDCYFGQIEGRASKKDLPSDRFSENCEIEIFTDSPETTKAISHMDLPLGVRVLLTILRKVYIQTVSGRKENALHRGLDHHGRRLVQPILQLLKSEGFVLSYKRAGLDMTIWAPDRGKLSRVKQILHSPNLSKDPLVQKASKID
mgnify:CR=1 FL=1